MADHPMRRPPEDFFIHPVSPTAMIMEDYIASPDHFRSTTWSDDGVPSTPPAAVFQLKPGIKTPEAAATIQDLVDEPIFWRGYTSDEEVASPLVDDTRSFDSSSFCYDSEDVVSVHDAPSPQHSSQSLNRAKKQVTQAQAVQFLSAGKAKVVSMPTPCTVKTAPSSPTPSSALRTNRMNVQGRAINFSRTIAPKKSDDIESYWRGTDSDEGSAYSQRIIRRKPDVPALQAAWRSQSPSRGAHAPVTPYSARRAGFVQPESTPVNSPLPEAAWFSQSNTPEDERPSSQIKKVVKGSRHSDPEPYPAKEASPVPDSPAFCPSPGRDGNYTHKRSFEQRPSLFQTGSVQIRDSHIAQDSPSFSPPRLLRKLSSTLSFKSSNRPSRPDSFSSNDSVKLPTVLEATSQPSHAIFDMHVPTRSSSKPVPKMVPRGANERAPPIVIPPCPEDYDDDDDLPARWPRKRDSKMLGPVADDLALESASKPLKTHQRKKSHSTSSGSGGS